MIENIYIFQKIRHFLKNINIVTGNIR